MDKILQKLTIEFYFKHAVNKSAVSLSTSVKKKKKKSAPLNTHTVVSKIKEENEFSLIGYLQISTLFT